MWSGATSATRRSRRALVKKKEASGDQRPHSARTCTTSQHYSRRACAGLRRVSSQCTLGRVSTWRLTPCVWVDGPPQTRARTPSGAAGAPGQQPPVTWRGPCGGCAVLGWAMRGFSPELSRKEAGGRMFSKGSASHRQQSICRPHQRRKQAACLCSPTHRELRGRPLGQCQSPAKAAPDGDTQKEPSSARISFTALLLLLLPRLLSETHFSVAE